VTAALESDIRLRDGTPVHIRPIDPADDLVHLFHTLSPESVYQRFFSAIPELSPGMARHLSHVNFTNRLALVAEAAGELIGVGRYERTTDPEVVELSLVVSDAWQNRGLGRLLLRETLRAAEVNGIHRFRADVLADNWRMLKLLAEECEIEHRKTEAGVTTLVLRTRPAS
jgi:RimJ/RimL family protein N-acetyltransferase